MTIEGEFELIQAKAVSSSLEVVTPIVRHGNIRAELPSNFALLQNYPNPFNPSTTIAFDVPASSDFRLSIYNVLGQEVKRFDGHAEAGTVRIEWDASEKSSGVYFYRLETPSGFESTKKMLLVK